MPVALMTFALVFGLFVLGSGGCGRDVKVTHTGGSGPMPPKPRPVEPAPAGAKANAVVLQVAPKPRDTNGNGYPDLIEVAAYLFAKPHPTPIYEDGVFVFTLYIAGQSDRPGAIPICEWRIGGEQLESAKVGQTLYGLTYAINLSLLTTSGDTFPLMPADLICRFEPADGREPVVRREVHTIQIGSQSAGRRP